MPRAPRHAVAAVGQALDRVRGPVVLVVDLAHDLLDDVLDGDDADGAAVLVDHDGQLQARLLHLAQEIVDALGLRDVGGGAHERAQVRRVRPRGAGGPSR